MSFVVGNTNLHNWSDGEEWIELSFSPASGLQQGRTRSKHGLNVVLLLQLNHWL